MTGTAGRRATAKGSGPLTPAIFHVLLALADGPLHGYAVMQAARASADAGTPMGPGTVYGSLQRLLDGGLVVELGSSSSGGRKRTFELTARGSEALRGEARRLIRLAELVRGRQLVPKVGR